MSTAVVRVSAAALAGAVTFVLVPVPGQADQGFFWPPRVEGELLVELQNDYIFDSDDQDAEINDLFTTTELTFDTYLAAPLFLNTHLTLEPVRDPEPGKDRYFGDQGLFVEELNLNYAASRWAIRGGKFNPNFSLAYDAAPGIWGTDLAEDDIEISEQIGFGGSITVFADERFGAHVLSGSVFFADTSLLSESFGANRGRTSKSDGGPANTGAPESFTIAIDGGDIAALPGFRYQVAGARLKVDRVLDEDGTALAGDDIDDEYRFSVTGEWAFPLVDDVTITPLLEYVRFWNGGGLKGENRHYLTAAGLLEYHSWNLAVSYTGRFINGSDVGDNDTLFQVSGGYTFDFGLSANAGYRLLDERATQSHTVGVFLEYILPFNF